MKRANFWLLLVCLAFLAGLLMLATMERVAKKILPETRRTHTPATVAPASSPDRPALAPPPQTADAAEGHPDAQFFGSATIPPEREAELLLEFLRAYRHEFGAFPTGNENAHFLNALAGANPGRLVVFPRNHPRVSENGELLDAWGNPFHFHPIDRHHLEVRSAGPDGELFTADDLTAP